MAWISVYQEVDGPKLRRLSKALKTSRAEALGILNFLWFWGMNNADETGEVLDADCSDIEEALNGITQIPSEKVVAALFEAGWLDDREDGIYLHDWDTWQENWYKVQKSRKKDAERKRRDRAAERERQVPEEVPEPEEPPKEEKPKKPKGPETKKYGEFVSMTEAEHDRLVERYGQIFAEACIEELDNYKGAKGRTYKNDYRAILSWVVDKVQEKKPWLLSASKNDIGDNPFEEWSE